MSREGREEPVGVPPRQYDATMIDFGFRQCGLHLRDDVFALNERAAASWTPVCYGIRGNLGMTLGTNSRHTEEIN